jgi:hypothetical protein
MKCWNCKKEFEEGKKEKYPNIDFDFAHGFRSFHAVFCSGECLIEGIKFLRAMLCHVKHDAWQVDEMLNNKSMLLDRKMEWFKKHKHDAWEEGILDE